MEHYTLPSQHIDHLYNIYYFYYVLILILFIYLLIDIKYNRYP